MTPQSSQVCPSLYTTPRSPILQRPPSQPQPLLHLRASTGAGAVHAPGACNVSSGPTSILPLTPRVSSQMHPSLHTLPESLHPNFPLPSRRIPSAVVFASPPPFSLNPPKPTLH